MTKEAAQTLSRVLGERRGQDGNLFEYSVRDAYHGFVALTITKRKKVCSFISCVEVEQRMPYKRILEIEDSLNHGEYPGYFKVEQYGNLVFYQYVRTMSNCFGYWNKAKNYTILINDGIKVLEEIASDVEKACEGGDMNV